MKKKKKLILITAVLFVVLAGAITFLLIRRLSDNVLGSPLVTGISKHACNREKDLSLKCFDLVGKAYVVSEQDSAKILDKLAATVKSKHLTDNKQFLPLDGKAMANKTRLVAAGSSDTNTYGRFLITTSYSGGLFGQYNFPYSKDGHALYATTFSVEGRDSSGSTYILNSEFGTTDVEAQTILKVAQTLPKDKYILMIAEN